MNAFARSISLFLLLLLPLAVAGPLPAQQPANPSPQAAPQGTLHSGMNISMSRRVSMRVVPDADFARALPNDARYEIGTCKVMLKRGLQPPQLLRTLNLHAPNGQVALAALTEGARPGDMLILEVSDVSRINYKGERIRENIDARDLIVSLVLTP